jgi:hypothetical protein
MHEGVTRERKTVREAFDQVAWGATAMRGCVAVLDNERHRSMVAMIGEKLDAAR